MTNKIDANGLQTNTQEEQVTAISTALKNIYGSDIDLSSSSPDAQLMMIYIQAQQDVLDLLKQINSSFDPDQAIGRLLDQRVALNAIKRKGGTYSYVPVVVTTNQIVNLYGLDQTAEDIFTLLDDSGNKWLLETTQLGVPIGANTLIFRAENTGAITVIPNSINQVYTVVLGVVNVVNNVIQSTTGVNEETDAQLKLRRQKSVAISSQGYLEGLYAVLQNIEGVNSVFIYENKTGSTNLDGQPEHSIWVIVSGNASDADIAQAIYTKRNAGCDMYGQKSYTITQVDGSPFVINWDEVTIEPVFIKFTVTSIDGSTPVDIAQIKTKLPSLYVPDVYEKLNVNDLATYVQQVDNNCLVTNAGFSLTSVGPFTDLIQPSSRNKQFSILSPNIIMLPMQISPISPKIARGDSRLFVAQGGYGSYTYSLSANASGGSINSAGLYVAGSITGTDTVKIQDSLGNYVTTNVTVI